MSLFEMISKLDLSEGVSFPIAIFNNDIELQQDVVLWQLLNWSKKKKENRKREQKKRKKKQKKNVTLS